MKYTPSSLEETQKIAQDFIADLLPKETEATIVGLYGNLGAGKTTFTQAVAKALGVEEKVASPTFVIEKIYELTHKEFTHLIHIDAYRIDNSSELTLLGFKEIISNPQNLILVEWPEKIADIMPEHIKISLKPLENENSREIDINTV